MVLTGFPRLVFCANLVAGFDRCCADFRERRFVTELRDSTCRSAHGARFPFAWRAAPTPHLYWKLFSSFLGDLFNLLTPVPRLQGFVYGGLDEALGELCGLLGVKFWEEIGHDLVNIQLEVVWSIAGQRIQGIVQPGSFPLLAIITGLGFSCRLLAGFGLASFLQANLLPLTLCLRAFLSLSLSFRSRRSAALGLLLSLLLLQLSQIAVQTHFFQFAPPLFDAFPLCRRADHLCHSSWASYLFV